MAGKGWGWWGGYLCKSQDPWKPLWRSMQGRYHEPLFSCCNPRTSNPPTAPPPVEDRPPPAPAHHRVVGQTWRHRRCHHFTGLLWVRRYCFLLAHKHCGPYTCYISTRPWSYIHNLIVLQRFNTYSMVHTNTDSAYIKIKEHLFKAVVSLLSWWWVAGDAAHDWSGHMTPIASISLGSKASVHQLCVFVCVRYSSYK